MVAKPTTILD